jgi:outer membrane protein assembly factor BamB
MSRRLVTPLMLICMIPGCAKQEKKVDGGPAVALAAQSFRREWAADLGLKNDEVEKVFAREDTVVAYTKDQQAFVINRDSGRIRFTTEITKSPIRPAPPVLLKDMIVFPTISTLEIYRRDGRLVRSYKLRNTLRTKAAGVPNGTRMFFGIDVPGAGRMVCMDLGPGSYEQVRQAWELMSDKGAPMNSTPAVHGGIVFAAFEDGWVYAVNVDSRAGIWSTSQGPQYRTFGPIQADLRADDFGVYVASTDTKFYCLDRNTGDTKWEYHARTPLRVPAEVTASTVYLPVPGRGIVAIDKQTGPREGQPKWAFPDGVKFLSEDEKFAYLQGKDNKVVAIDRETGKPAFTSKRTDLIVFAVNTKGDGLIYAGTNDGQVLAIAPVLRAGFMGEVAQWAPVEDRETLALK